MGGKMYNIIRGEINWNVMLDITKEGRKPADSCGKLYLFINSHSKQNYIPTDVSLFQHSRATSPTPVAALLNLTFAIV